MLLMLIATTIDANKALTRSEEMITMTAYAYFYYGCTQGAQLNDPTIECREITKETLKDINE